VRKLFHAFALFAVIAALIAAGGLSTAPAVQKDKDKEKKDEIGKIEVFQAKDGWRFRVVNEEGKSVAIGTVGFEKKEDCLKTLEYVKTTLAKAKVTEIKSDKKDKDKKDK
jgi:uncharacterized protein YegP (UPF0339 family)